MSFPWGALLEGAGRGASNAGTFFATAGLLREKEEREKKAVLTLADILEGAGLGVVDRDKLVNMAGLVEPKTLADILIAFHKAGKQVTLTRRLQDLLGGESTPAAAAAPAPAATVPVVTAPGNIETGVPAFVGPPPGVDEAAAARGAVAQPSAPQTELGRLEDLRNRLWLAWQEAVAVGDDRAASLQTRLQYVEKQLEEQRKRAARALIAAGIPTTPATAVPADSPLGRLAAVEEALKRAIEEGNDSAVNALTQMHARLKAEVEQQKQRDRERAWFEDFAQSFRSAAGVDPRDRAFDAAVNAAMRHGFVPERLPAAAGLSTDRLIAETAVRLSVNPQDPNARRVYELLQQIRHAPENVRVLTVVEEGTNEFIIVPFDTRTNKALPPIRTGVKARPTSFNLLEQLLTGQLPGAAAPKLTPEQEAESFLKSLK